MKYYLLTFNQDHADEHNVPALQCFKEKQYKQWLSTEVGSISANLGNSGDGFEEAYEDYEINQELVDDGTVDVTEVDKSFYDFFHDADLNSLSLTNVFEINKD